MFFSKEFDEKFEKQPPTIPSSCCFRFSLSCASNCCISASESDVVLSTSSTTAAVSSVLKHWKVKWPAVEKNEMEIRQKP